RRRRSRELLDLPLAAALPEPIHLGTGNAVPGQHHRRRLGRDCCVLPRGEAGSACPPGAGRQVAPRAAAAATTAPPICRWSRRNRSLATPLGARTVCVPACARSFDM